MAFDDKTVYRFLALPQAVFEQAALGFHNEVRPFLTNAIGEYLPARVVGTQRC
nr:hypothetical protein [Azoarcus taiwanensis]